MNTEQYIDHELRIRMLEIISRQTLNRLNALITIAVTSVVLPLVLKYFGA